MIVEISRNGRVVGRYDTVKKLLIKTIAEIYRIFSRDYVAQRPVKGKGGAIFHEPVLLIEGSVDWVRSVLAELISLGFEIPKSRQWISKAEEKKKK